ncbi:hypothetical protein RhiLY_10281 [Ceratobasidium sp. AG-Ba]|nr:hypothetical protein RhiLY_10281 [Ceratobasidium sp. AG-Ba]
MDLRQTTAQDDAFRHRIQGIRLEPDTSKYDIAAEIQTDGSRLCKLPRIEKGRRLEWDDIYAWCDVRDGTLIGVQVAEVRTMKKGRTGRAEYQVFRASSSDSLSIVCSHGGNPMFVVHIKIIGKDSTKQAWTEALSAMNAINQRVHPMDSPKKAARAFEKMAALSEFMAQLDPSGGAQTAVWVCMKALEQLDSQQRPNAVLEDLIESLASTIPTIESVESVADANLKATLVKMQKLVEDTSVYVLTFKQRNRSERTIYKMLSSTGAQDIPDALFRRSKQLRTEFNERMNAQMLRTGQLNEIRERLKELNPARLAGYNPYRVCLEGTRSQVINALATWVKTNGEERKLAWMHGLAGLGKSSIATSVCDSLHAQGLLASSFFCKRDSPELRDPHRVLTTTVYELARRWHSFGETVSKVIGNNPGFFSNHLQPLYELLIANTCKAITTADRPLGRMAVVVDALDECGDAITRRQLLMCLRDMSQLVPFLRIIVTSRTDEDIKSYFLQGDTDWYTEFNLMQYDARLDIQIFVEQSLGPLTSIPEWPNDAVDRVTNRANGLFIWAKTACAYILSGLDKVKSLEQLTSGKRLPGIDELYEAILTAYDTVTDAESLEELLNYLGVIVVTSMRRAMSVSTLSALIGKHASRVVIQGVVDRLSSVLYIDETLGGAIRVSHPSFMDYITDHGRSKKLCIDVGKNNTTLARCCIETMKNELKFNICGLETSHRWNQDVPDLGERVQRAISPQLSYACEFWSSHLAEAAADTIVPLLHDFLFGPGVIYWLEALSVLGKLMVAPANLLRVARWCTEDPISASAPHIYISALPMAPSNSLISKEMRTLFPNTLSISSGVGSEWTPCIRSISAGSPVHSVAVSPDGKQIASGCDDGMVRIWNVETGQATLLPLQGHWDVVTCIAYSHDGQRIVSGSADRTIRVWAADTGECISGPFIGHSDRLNDIVWSHSDNFIISGSEGGSVRLWCSATGVQLLHLLPENARSILRVASSADDLLIASASNFGVVRLWDAKIGHMISQFQHQAAANVVAMRFSQDDQTLIVHHRNHEITLWNINASNGIVRSLPGPQARVESAAFTPDNRYITCAYLDFRIAVWDVEQHAVVLGPVSGHSAEVTSVDMAPSENRIVSGSLDTTIRIWEGPAGLRHTSSISTDFIPHWDTPTRSMTFTAAFSSDSRLVASGHHDKTVWVWDAETGHAVIGPLEGPSILPDSLLFSSDNSLVYCGSQDGMFCAWDILTGRLVCQTLVHHTPGSIDVTAISPDGKLLVGASEDGTVSFWDTTNGMMTLGPLVGHSGLVHAIAFSPDGHRVVSGSGDKTVRVWDVNTGSACFEPMEGHSKSVSSVAYSPDGVRIASGSSDTTICVWDALTGDLILTLQEGRSFKVSSLVFSHDGQHIVSGSTMGTLRVWDVEAEGVVCEQSLGYESYLNCLALSPNSCHVAAPMGDGFIHLLDISHYLRPDLPLRYLPGTTIPALPEHLAGDKLMVPAGQVAHHIDGSHGWVTRSDGSPLVWLPPELRQVKASYMRIAYREIHRPMIDFTRFVHGEDWISVKRN